jgi:hypothetical protein
MTISDPIPLLQLFAQYYQLGTIALSGTTVWSKTVEDTLWAMGQAFATLGQPDPYLTAMGKLDLRLSCQLLAYKKQDPPPSRVKPIPLPVIGHAADFFRWHIPYGWHAAAQVFLPTAPRGYTYTANPEASPFCLCSWAWLLNIILDYSLGCLNSKRCLSYLKESMQVLEGLTSLYTDIIGTPLWLSVDDKYLTLFWWKIYLSNTYIDIGDITNFLEMPPEQILSIGAKLLLNTTSKADSKKITDSLKLTDINMEEYTDNTLLTEILLNFNQNLCFTAFDLWNQHKDKARKTAAGINLSAKMKAMKTVNAT